MRYLNKIVFLNSAHIPYAEVCLDGNVHFIGTQGVGKSTVLRALLFFYNADKLHLGIPKEKKPFDAFYFPYANSYIVYEVMRENGAYCVLTLKSQGRAAFRFIDAPYSAKWFMDERKQVYPEWTSIREHIGKGVQYSSLVSSYDMFRDIIFGNNKSHDMIPYRKYAMVESAKYQNIPRTIQNVFLNTKLDANFIKTTIIRSMSAEEEVIDLNFYREQIKGFEQEYKDVSLWTKKNKAGEIFIRRLADKVIEQYRALLYNRSEIAKMRRRLNYAERLAGEQLPQIRNEISEREALLNRIVRLINEEDEKHRRELNKYVSDIAIIDNKLKESAAKRSHYASMNISDIISRVSQENIVEEEKRRQEALKAELEQSYSSIVDKYKSLIEKIDVDLRAFEVNIESQRAERSKDVSREKELLMLEFHKAEDSMRSVYAERLRTENEKLQQFRDEENAFKVRKAGIAAENPFVAEIDECNNNIRTLNENDRILKLKIESQKESIDRAEHDAAAEVEKLEVEQHAVIEALQAERDEIARDSAGIKGLLGSRKGSLFEWLDANVKNWQDTIGRVVDEESVLYNDALNPRLTDVGNATLYGVDISLAGLKRKFRTPEELRRRLAENEKHDENLCNKLSQTRAVHEAEKNALKKKCSQRLRPLREELTAMELDSRQLPLQLKNAEVELRAAVKRLADWRNEQIAILDNKINELADRICRQCDAIRGIEKEQSRRLSTLQTERKAKFRDMETTFKQFEESLELQLSDKRRSSAEDKRRMEELQQAELSGQGMDISLFEAYSNKISALIAELDYIRRNREIVFAYNKDKIELFDLEPQMRRQRKLLTESQNMLEDKYNRRLDKFQTDRKNASETLEAARRQLSDFEQGLREVRDFRSDSTLCPENSFDSEELATNKSCHELVERLKSLIVGCINNFDSFKKSSLQFLGQFSSGNTFNFNTQPVTDDEFMEFASNLCEFIENDKIEEYKKGISDRYTFIINRISKEVGDITRRSGDIRKTIEDINRDFVERNFAGVIKEIALRPLPSSDQLMQLLNKIKEFNDEHQYDMGEMDLFSSDNRDEANGMAVRYLFSFMKGLLDDPNRKQLQVADTFKLEFRIKENDNDTGWIEKIANVGSDGTDILVKAMVNIMLINVFKEKASKKFGDFKIHCMMDEIGKLHPNNVKGILDFANRRNILLVNSSPTTYNVEDYKYTYLLSKDAKSNTQVVPLVCKV